MTTNNIRPVEQVITAHRQREGGGFIVRRPFPTLGLRMADPFLLLDEMGPVDYVVLEWPRQQPTGEVIPMILDLVDQGVIRILDAAFLVKDEDGAEASLAGIHDSLLHVTGPDAVIAAIEHCWRSFYAAPAVVARSRSADATSRPRSACRSSRRWRVARCRSRCRWLRAARPVTGPARRRARRQPSARAVRVAA